MDADAPAAAVPLSISPEPIAAKPSAAKSARPNPMVNVVIAPIPIATATCPGVTLDGTLCQTGIPAPRSRRPSRPAHSASDPVLP